MRSIIKERSIILVILFSIITFGIYSFVLYFIFGSELKAESDRQNTGVSLVDPFIAFLLSIVTCGFYGIYYIYMQASALERLGRKFGVMTIEPIVLIIFTLFFGVGFYINVYSGSKISVAIDRTRDNKTTNGFEMY